MEACRNSSPPPDMALSSFLSPAHNQQATDLCIMATDLCIMASL